MTEIQTRDQEKLEQLVMKARTLGHYGRQQYWRGYMRGLRRGYFGDRYATTEQHSHWLQEASESGRGYRDGLLAARVEVCSGLRQEVEEPTEGLSPEEFIAVEDGRSDYYDERVRPVGREQAAQALLARAIRAESRVAQLESALELATKDSR